MERGGWVAVGLGALLSVTIGCGDDGPDEAERRDAYAEAWAAVSVLDDLWSDEARLCAGRAVVVAGGLDDMEAIGTPEQVRGRDDRVPGELGVDLSDQEIQTFYEEMDACTDVQEVYLGTLEADRELPAGVASCLRDRADDEFLRDWSHARFVLGAAEDSQQIRELQRDVHLWCVAEAQSGGGR